MTQEMHSIASELAGQHYDVAAAVVRGAANTLMELEALGLAPHTLGLRILVPGEERMVESMSAYNHPLLFQYLAYEGILQKGEQISFLTPSEKKIIDKLLLTPNRLVSHMDLAHELYPGFGETDSNRTARIYIQRIRKKLPIDEKWKYKVITNVLGYGYKWVDDPDEFQDENAA